MSQTTIAPTGASVDGTVDGSVEQRALERISVRSPYFDLRQLSELGSGIVSAEVPLTEPSAPETGAIEAAQVARHLAILGSCAAALAREDDARHHYLATKAHYSRLSNAPAVATGPLQAEAIASWVDRRTARALIKLTTASGQGLHLLDVDYTVLTPKMFSRFNPPIETDLGGAPPSILGPEADGELQPVEIPDGLRLDCGIITPDDCAGHFPDYPAAPVAIVMGRLCRAAGLAMNRHLNTPDGRYRIEEGRVVASKLARAGQRLVLEARYAKPVRGGHQLTGVALADGDTVGEVVVTLSAHSPAPIDPEGSTDVADGQVEPPAETETIG
jgi:hypothetical protein